MSDDRQPAIPQAPVLQVPGMTCQLEVNLGEQDRKLMFQTFFDRDVTAAEMDAVLDKMQRAADRKRAQHLLPGYRRNRENVQHDLDENRKRIKAKEAEIAEGDKIVDERITPLRARLGEVIAAQADEWHQSGKRSEFKPTRSKATAEIEKQIDDLLATQLKAHNEAEQLTRETQNVIDQGIRALEQLNAMIKELEALAADQPL